MLAIEACHVRVHLRSSTVSVCILTVLLQKAVHDMGCPRVATDIRKLRLFRLPRGVSDLMGGLCRYRD